MKILITYRLHDGRIWQWTDVPTVWLAVLAELLDADLATFIGDDLHPGDCLRSSEGDGFYTVDIAAFEVDL